MDIHQGESTPIPNPEHPLKATEEKGEILFHTRESYLAKLEEGGLEEHKVTFEKVCELAEAIKEMGGRALLVGGTVRDAFFGKIPKDYDLEVHEIEPQRLKALMEQFGNVKDIGESFGILHLPVENGLGIDVSLPRTDSKILESEDEHGGFEVKSDPYMGIKEAAKRRDFTMNALAADPLTGELFDYYGGLDDINAGLLRATDKILFADDALRVLRGLQFVSRFGLKIEDDTAEVMRAIAPRIEKLSHARTSEEWRKLLLKGDKPSLGLNAGLETGVFEILYPELAVLKNIPQDKKHHPEGDVFVHTGLVVDHSAAIVKREGLKGDDAFVILLADLCHDFGKALTTKTEVDGRITAHGHEVKGKDPALKFLDSITDEVKIKERVIQLVTHHMMPGEWYRTTAAGKKVSDSAIERLSRKLFPATIAELVLVCESDFRGTGLQGIKDNMEYKPGIWLTNKAQELGVYKEKPKNLFTGKDLLAIGYKPGKPMGVMIGLGQKIRGFQNMLRELEQGDAREPYTKEEALALISHTQNSEEGISILRNLAYDTLQKIRRLRKERRNANVQA